MNDLISRQAAIDAFLTEFTKRERKNLPEDRQRCLVTIRDGREPEVDIVGYATNLNEVSLYDLPDSKPGWYGFDSEYGYYEQTGVTAWMPLPESYREEGEK